MLVLYNSGLRPLLVPYTMGRGPIVLLITQGPEAPVQLFLHYIILYCRGLWPLQLLYLRGRWPLKCYTIMGLAAHYCSAIFTT